MENQKNINFTCPKCERKFSFDELFNHNLSEFNELIEAQVNEKLNKMLLEKVKETEAKMELKFQNKLQEKELTFASEREGLKIELRDQQSVIRELEKNKSLELAKNKEEIQNQFSTEIADLKLKIQNRDSLIKTQEIKFNQELNSLKQERELQFLKEKEKIEEIFRKQIEELKIKNAENRILQNKIKGENWELEVENELYKAFGYFDKIEKITTGTQKADYLQIVKNNNKKEIGKIVYEVKNAKWSDSWLPKLSVDVANNKTKYGILVASSFNEKFHGDISFIRSSEYENIWIADPFSFVFVAQVVRKIIEIESSFLEKEEILTTLDNSSYVIKYKEQVVKLKDYISYKLPIFIKTFKKQLKDIDGVKNSLLKSSDKLGKTVEILTKRFDKLIKQELERITGERIIEIENEVSIEDFNSKETNINNEDEFMPETIYCINCGRELFSSEKNTYEIVDNQQVACTKCYLENEHFIY